MQIVSEEESRRWKAEVERLRASKSVEDQIVAILMDLEIGGSGNSGDSVRAKARAICELVNLQVSELQKELAGLRHTGQHMTCGQCEQLRETQKLVGESPAEYAERIGMTPLQAVQAAFSQKPKQEGCTCGTTSHLHDEACGMFTEKRKDDGFKRNCPNCGAVGYCECK